MSSGQEIHCQFQIVSETDKYEADNEITGVYDELGRVAAGAGSMNHQGLVLTGPW